MQEYVLHALSQPRMRTGDVSPGGNRLSKDRTHPEGSSHDPLRLHWAGQALSGAVQQVLHPGLRRRSSSEGAEHLAGSGRRADSQLQPRPSAAVGSAAAGERRLGLGTARCSQAAVYGAGGTVQRGWAGADLQSVAWQGSCPLLGAWAPSWGPLVNDESCCSRTTSCRCGDCPGLMPMLRAL